MNQQPQNIYLTPERVSRLDLLCHLLANGRKPVLLRGPVGAGKRFFLEQFSTRLADINLVAELQGEDVFADRNELMQLLATLLDGLDSSLLGALSALAARGERLVLVVHDAHQMPDGQLSELMDLDEAHDSIFLVLSTAENLAEFDRYCQIIDLEPFTQKQTIEYARKLLLQEDQSNIDALPLDELVLFIETGGLPGRIHDAVSKRAFDAPVGFSPSTNSKNAPINKWLYGVPLLAALIAVALYMFMFNDEPFDAEPPVSNDLATKPSVPVLSTIANDESPTELVLDRAAQTTNAGLPKKPLVAAVPASKAEDSSGEPQLNKSKAALEVAKPVSSSKPTKPEPKIDLEPVESAPSVEPDKAEQVLSPMDGKKGKLVDAAPVDSSVSAKEKAGLASKQDDTLSVSDASKKAKPAAITRLASDRSWIQSMSGEQYTLQIMGLGQQSAAEAYVAKFPQVDGLYIYRSKRNQGAWYAILYGAYPSRTAAMDALPAVRKQFPGVQPWPRRFDAVQQDLY